MHACVTINEQNNSFSGHRNIRLLEFEKFHMGEIWTLFVHLTDTPFVENTPQTADDLTVGTIEN